MEFVDGRGNTLHIAPTMATLKRVRMRTGKNLIDGIVEGEVDVDGNTISFPALLMEFETDHVLLAEVLHAACRDQIDCDCDEWLESATADVIEAGRVALMKALPLFFIRSESRALMQAHIDRNEIAQRTYATARQSTVMTGLPSPTTAPESLDSTPIPEPSENSLKPLTESSETSGTDSPH